MNILMLFGSSLLIFVVAYVFMRVMGKRAVAQMSAFDLVVVILLGAMLATPLTMEGTMTRTLFTSTFLVIVYLGFSYLMLNNRARKIIHEKPTIIINKGNVNETGLRKVRMTVPELLGLLRVKGYSTLSDVEFAIMESGGDISILPKSQHAPVTKSDLKLQQLQTALPVPVIVAGEWNDENLSLLRKNREWVIEQLRLHNANSLNLTQLTLVQVEPDGTLTVDKNESAMEGNSTDKKYGGTGL